MIDESTRNLKNESKPKVSVVVVVYNIAPRGAPRTLYSLSAQYQRHIDAADFEVIVVDNGSSPPFDPQIIKNLSGNFRLIRIDQALPSPAQAVNRGIKAARGEVIGVMIDGARLATPGLIHFALQGARLYDRAIVTTLGWYLGSDLQRFAIESGYDQPREDALLESIGWPQDGYRLFEIGTMDDASVDGWFNHVSESNALFLNRELWDMLDGMDERFDEPGGGLVNPDAYRRAVELPDTELVVLLGEGTFHQLHGGVANNASVDDLPDFLLKWHKQYEAIRGVPFAIAGGKTPSYIGTLHRAALAHFARAIIYPMREPPLGLNFNAKLWSPDPIVQPSNPTVALLTELAQREFLAHRYQSATAVSRLILSLAPEEPEPKRLLRWIGPSLADRVGMDSQADYHLALAEAYRLLGDNEAAKSQYPDAMEID